MHTVFISNTHPINKLSKPGTALVNTVSSLKTNMFHPWKNTSVRLHHYLPITATSLQQPLPLSSSWPLWRVSTVTTKNTFYWWDLVYLKLYSQVFNLCLFNFLPRVCWFSKQVICTPCVPIFTTWALAWSKSKASLRLRLFCLMKCMHQYKQKIWKYFGFVAKINFFLLSLI